MVIQTQGKRYQVYLGDDGTMDTVVTVSDHYGHSTEVRFSGDDNGTYRWRHDGSMTIKGLRALGLEAIEALEEEISNPIY